MKRVSLPYCSGTCLQGRAACDCQSGMTELSNGVPPRLEFPAPDRTREDDVERAEALCFVLIVNAIAFASMAVVMYLF